MYCALIIPHITGDLALIVDATQNGSSRIGNIQRAINSGRASNEAVHFTGSVGIPTHDHAMIVNIQWLSSRRTRKIDRRIDAIPVSVTMKTPDLIIMYSDNIAQVIHAES